MEHCAEGPTVKDSVGHFTLCKGVAVCIRTHVFVVMCICPLLLITSSSHHDDDDGGAGVHEALFSLSLVDCSGTAIVLGFHG